MQFLKRVSALKVEALVKKAHISWNHTSTFLQFDTILLFIRFVKKYTLISLATLEDGFLSLSSIHN